MTEHKVTQNIAKTRIVVAPKINKRILWALFDGTIQGDPPQEGSGEFLYLLDKHKFIIKYAPRQCSNIKAELATLWVVLNVAQ